jgi:hypothetical protein
MNHYDNEDWEFQWVEESVNYTGHVFVEGLKGLSYVLGSLVTVAIASVKEKTKK